MLTALRPNFVDAAKLTALWDGIRAGHKFRPLKVPIAAAIDRRITEDALALYAYRSAQLKQPYHLHRTAVRRYLGLSKQGFYDALDCLTGFGVLHRDVVAGRVRSERVNPEAFGGERIGEIVVPYALIGILSPPLLSFYLFALSGFEPRGLYPRDYEFRFCCSRQTVLRRLSVLESVGLIKTEQNRNEDGRFNGTSFHGIRIVLPKAFKAEPPPDNCAQMQERTQTLERNNPEGQNAPTYKAATAVVQGLCSIDTHVLGTADAEPSHTHDALAFSRKPVADGAGGAISWAYDDDISNTDWGDALSDDVALAKATDAISDKRIFDDVMGATDGRFAGPIVFPPDLCGYRHLVAGVMHKRACGAEAAHDYLLEVLRRTIGDTTRVLRSWAYLGKTIAHRVDLNGPEAEDQDSEDRDVEVAHG